jgi:hypothetical protein
MQLALNRQGYTKLKYVIYQTGTWGSVVVKELRYKLEGPRSDSRCHRESMGSTQPLKLSARIIVGVKAAGA